MDKETLEALVREAVANIKNETPEVPEANTETPEVPEANTETPEVPEANTETPEVPEANTETPEVPEANTETPEVPEANTETPEVPEANTETPEVPEANAETLDIASIVQDAIKMAIKESTNSGYENNEEHLTLGDTLEKITKELSDENASISDEQKAILEFLVLNNERLEANAQKLLEPEPS